MSLKNINIPHMKLVSIMVSVYSNLDQSCPENQVFLIWKHQFVDSCMKITKLCSDMFQSCTHSFIGNSTEFDKFKLERKRERNRIAATKCRWLHFLWEWSETKTSLWILFFLLIWMTSLINSVDSSYNWAQLPLLPVNWWLCGWSQVEIITDQLW